MDFFEFVFWNLVEVSPYVSKGVFASTRFLWGIRFGFFLGFLGYTFWISGSCPLFPPCFPRVFSSSLTGIIVKDPCMRFFV